MQVQQRLPPIPPLGEVGVEGNAGKFAFQVQGIGFAVHGVVQHAVDIGENVILGDARGLAAMGGELGHMTTASVATVQFT